MRGMMSCVAEVGLARQLRGGFSLLPIVLRGPSAASILVKRG
jgi:hypothetical protein